MVSDITAPHVNCPITGRTRTHLGGLERNLALVRSFLLIKSGGGGGWFWGLIGHLWVLACHCPVLTPDTTWSYMSRHRTPCGWVKKLCFVFEDSDCLQASLLERSVVHVLSKQVNNGQLLFDRHTFCLITGPLKAGQEGSTQFRHTYCLSPDTVEQPDGLEAACCTKD